MLSIERYRQENGDLTADFAAVVAGHCEYYLASQKSEICREVFIEQMLSDYAGYKPKRDKLNAELQEQIATRE